MVFRIQLLAMLLVLSYFPGTAYAESEVYLYRRVRKEFAESYRSLLTAPFSFDEAYTLKEETVPSVFKAIHRYLAENQTGEFQEFKILFPHHYGFQLLGIKSKGSRMILINAFSRNENARVSDTAVVVRDGACSYVRLLFDLEKDSIVSFECNGEA